MSSSVRRRRGGESALTRVATVMGTVASVRVTGPGADSRVVRRAVESTLAELGRLDRLLSPHRADSAVASVRRGEFAPTDRPELAELLTACRQMSVASAGVFTDRLPRTLGVVEGHGEWGDWDPTGLAKGWAGERAARCLRDLVATPTGGRLRWCVGIGGDIVCDTGAEATEREWRVGVASLRRPSECDRVITLAAGGVATSSLSERGAHLWDPRTCRFPVADHGVTVVAPTLTQADAWATVLWLTGRGGTALCTRAVPRARVHWSVGRGSVPSSAVRPGSLG